MPKIDRKELNDKAKSKYGFYQGDEENSLKKTLYEVFLKSTPFKTFINGAATAVIIFYWLFTKNLIPLFVWFVYIMTINLAGYFYWHTEEKRLNNELQRLDTEMQGLKAEINDRQTYFQNLKNKIDKGEIKP